VNQKEWQEVLQGWWAQAVTTVYLCYLCWEVSATFRAQLRALAWDVRRQLFRWRFLLLTWAWRGDVRQQIASILEERAR